MRDTHFRSRSKRARPRSRASLSANGCSMRWRNCRRLPSGCRRRRVPASRRWPRATPARRKKPLVWYRLDERDNDPAFFYAEFAEAVHSQARLTKQLPKFSSDDHDRQHDFAQRFAAALSEQPAKPTLFVLDDVQTHRKRSDATSARGAGRRDGERPRASVRFAIDSTYGIFRFDRRAATCLVERRRSAFRSRRMQGNDLGVTNRGRAQRKHRCLDRRARGCIDSGLRAVARYRS